MTAQRALLQSSDDYILVFEHPPTYTRGVRTQEEHFLVPPESLNAVVIDADRGGDVTYHAPGQVVAWAIVTVADDPSAGKAHVTRLEDAVIATVRHFDPEGRLGRVDRLDGYPGVWADVDGAPVEDRRGRRANRTQRHGTSSHVARCRVERGHRHGGVHGHRAVRHPRQARGLDDVARIGRHRARGRRASRRRTRSSSRGSGARRARRTKCGHGHVPSDRCCDDCARPASIPTRACRFTAASPSGCASRRTWATSTSRCARSPKTSDSSRSARRPAARTSSNAGRPGPRRSW